MNSEEEDVEEKDMVEKIADDVAEAGEEVIETVSDIVGGVIKALLP